MPLEFSAAAFRFGHSMVRPEYQLNEKLPNPHSIFAGNTNQPNLRGFREFPAQWAIDWRFFIDLDVIDYRDIDNQGDRDLVHRRPYRSLPALHQYCYPYLRQR